MSERYACSRIPTWFAAAAFVLGGVRAATAQEVRGQVWDRINNRGVSDGVVTLVAAGGTIVARAAVGPQGQYAFRAPDAGRYVLQFAGPGYGVSATEFTLAAAETRILRLEVTPLPPAELDTVVVEGQPVPRRLSGFHQRRASGLGEFITREQIEASNPRVLTDVLRRTSGVEVVRFDGGARIASRRDPTLCGGMRGAALVGPLMFLDGTFLGNGMEADMDALLSIQTIEAVEVYSGATTVPPEFNRSGAECGVVALWTRPGAAVETPYVRPVDFGAQVGGWIVSGGMQEGRVGGRAIIGIWPGVEMTAAVNAIVSGLETGNAGTNRTGSQIVLAPRGRPLGERSPWYVGGGFTYLSLSESRFGADEEDHLLAMTGVSLRRGRASPFVEVQLLDPFDPGDAQVHWYAGVTLRLY